MRWLAHSTNVDLPGRGSPPQSHAMTNSPEEPSNPFATSACMSSMSALPSFCFSRGSKHGGLPVATLTFRHVLQNSWRGERTQAMKFDALRSPVHFLQQIGISADQDWLREYVSWLECEGQGISDAVDRAGTPWLRMFDRLGARVDEILYPPEYRRMLQQGYRAGVLWRAVEQRSLLPSYLLLYATAFYDPGLACPYTV